MSGSSMATPHIAGLAALLWEAKPTATAAEIEKAICDSCRLTGALTSDRANRGEPSAVDAFTRLTGIALSAAAAPGPAARAMTPKPSTTASAAKRKSTAKKSRSKKPASGKRSTARRKTSAKATKRKKSRK